MTGGGADGGTRPRIVLLHATTVAMAPIAAAMAALWPEAEPAHLLDESLSLDRAREGAALSRGLSDRLVALGRQGVEAGAAGILTTCSAFGPAIERLAYEAPVPVLKPNEPMFRAALAAGRRIGMLATFAPAVASMEEEFRALAAETGSPATLDTVLVEGAGERLRAGDAEAHNALVAARANAFDGHDALLLAHFSTARALSAVTAVAKAPVFAAPEMAVRRMRALVETTTPALAAAS